MKLKRLLPITALVAVSPVVTLATGCDKDNDIDVNIRDVKETATSYFTVVSQKFKKINTDKTYEISIEFDEFYPAPQISEWSQIDTWWVRVSNASDYDPKEGNFNIQKVEVNDTRLSKDQYIYVDGTLEIKGRDVLQKPMGGWGETEIDIDLKISKPLTDVWFVFYFAKTSE